MLYICYLILLSKPYGLDYYYYFCHPYLGVEEIEAQEKFCEVPSSTSMPVECTPYIYVFLVHTIYSLSNKNLGPLYFVPPPLREAHIKYSNQDLLQRFLSYPK